MARDAFLLSSSSSSLLRILDLDLLTKRNRLDGKRSYNSALMAILAKAEKQDTPKQYLWNLVSAMENMTDI